MMNRRRFLHAAAAGSALVSGVSRAFAQEATYDLIIRGGRVIDPSLRIDAIRDVAIARGRIAAVEATIAGRAADTSTHAARSWCLGSSTSTRTRPGPPKVPGSSSGTA